jgi:homoserine dehydrogenase
MSVVADHAAAASHARRAASTVVPARVALLGLGRVGRAVADIVRHSPHCLGRPVRITGALVRNTDARAGDAVCPVVDDASVLLRDHEAPDAVIEVLGGLEPARSLVLSALARGIPVVTANKSLLAEHGDELIETARRSRTAFRCEASVLAGVPFLGTFATRPLAASIDTVTGILNGTSNFILSRMSDGVAFTSALKEAQQLGLAEPDPSKDLDGIDAAEKLAVLIRQFAGLAIRACDIPSTPLHQITLRDLEHSRELGGTVKAVAFAQWTGDGRVCCFSGPAFVPNSDPLAHLTGVLNGVRLQRTGQEPLCFTGPGAGPEVTARAILDDLAEILQAPDIITLKSAVSPAFIGQPSTLGWYLRFASNHLPGAVDIADLLAAHGIWIQRWGPRDTRCETGEQRVLTFPCRAEDLDAALEALCAASSCTANAFPALGSINE